jgi:hypothetical protein
MVIGSAGVAPSAPAPATSETWRSATLVEPRTNAAIELAPGSTASAALKASLSITMGAATSCTRSGTAPAVVAIVAWSMTRCHDVGS